MKRIFILTFTLFFITNYILAQEKCNVSKLSIEQKRQLLQFWTDLKKAAKSKNEVQLSKLFRFPFTCSFCVSESSKDSSYVTIKKSNFKQYLNKMIFARNFIEMLNSKTILQILNSDIGENGECNLSFSFPIVKPSLYGEGLQGFFTIKKIGENFKIISAWSVP